MKIKWGALVVEGRGKAGGHVASRNRAGAYLRNKVTPTNPQTAYQVGARNRLSGLSAGWRALTASQRAAWNAAVSDYARTDIFGDLKNPSGFNLYQRLNNNLLICGESQINTPPVPESVFAFTSFSAAVVTGTPAVNLTFAGAIPATDKVKLYATSPQSPGKSFVKSEYRLIDVLEFGDTSVHDAVSEYTAKFGSVGASGQKLFFKMVPVNITTGQEGVPITASCISTAV